MRCVRQRRPRNPDLNELMADGYPLRLIGMSFVRKLCFSLTCQQSRAERLGVSKLSAEVG